MHFSKLLFLSCAIFLCLAPPLSAAEQRPVVVFETTYGTITLQLNPEKAPISVENFLKYVDAGFYDNTIFHRVIQGFVIQGGGYDPQLVKKDTQAPIRNESGNGLYNSRGTISYARTRSLHSATSQFFINLVNNSSLDSGKYCVFGEVQTGMAIVDNIAETRTTRYGGMGDVPVQPIIITKAYRKTD